MLVDNSGSFAALAGTSPILICSGVLLHSSELAMIGLAWGSGLAGGSRLAWLAWGSRPGCGSRLVCGSRLCFGEGGGVGTRRVSSTSYSRVSLLPKLPLGHPLKPVLWASSQASPYWSINASACFPMSSSGSSCLQACGTGAARAPPEAAWQRNHCFLLAWMASNVV